MNKCCYIATLGWRWVGGTENECGDRIESNLLDAGDKGRSAVYICGAPSIGSIGYLVFRFP